MKVFSWTGLTLDAPSEKNDATLKYFMRRMSLSAVLLCAYYFFTFSCPLFLVSSMTCIFLQIVALHFIYNWFIISIRITISCVTFLGSLMTSLAHPIAVSAQYHIDLVIFI